jgi:trans-aconitate methyltransferase
MGDSWAKYEDFRSRNPAAENYYALVDECFVQALDTMLGNRKVATALDLACGAGASTRHLLNRAERIVGIDSSPALIAEAQSNPQLADCIFTEADALEVDLAETFELVTALWLHNYLHTEEQQRQMLEKILAWTEPDGAIAFLFPGQGYRSDKLQAFAETIGWHQQWLESSPLYARCQFSVSGGQQETMTCWEPLWLAELYASCFDLHFVDTRRVCLEGGFLDTWYLDPPFEVMYGFRRDAG